MEVAWLIPECLGVRLATAASWRGRASIGAPGCHPSLLRVMHAHTPTSLKLLNNLQKMSNSTLLQNRNITDTKESILPQDIPSKKTPF